MTNRAEALAKAPRRDHSRTESGAVKAALLAKFTYCPESGVFTNKRTGKPAGHSNGYGYLKLCAAGVQLLAHRAAFFFMTGEFPKELADHINGIRSDNRWSNLRDVDNKINNENMRGGVVRNKSGFIGSHKHAKYEMYRAMISVNKKNIHLGCFKTAEEAHAAYVEAKRKFHKGCTL